MNPMIPKLKRCDGLESCRALTSDDICVRCRRALVGLARVRVDDTAADFLSANDGATVDQAIAVAEYEEDIIYGVSGGAAPKGLI